MVNDIIRAIAKPIHEEYGDDYAIYTNKIKQDFKEPCFIIKALKPARKKVTLGRWENSSQFTVRYYPAKKSNTECYKVADELLDTLEQITLLDEDSSILLGIDMDYEIVDDVLHFFVTYKACMKEIDEEQDMMETINTDIRSKNG